MKLIIFGPQGSGKGTQAKLLAKKLGVEHISVGAVMRNLVEKKTSLGKKIAPYIKKGILVPFEINLEILKHSIKNKQGFILDGFPRDKKQSKALDKLVKINNAILLEVPDTVDIKRISGRRICDRGHEYNINSLPPKVEGICDVDGGKLHVRPDDTPKAIKKRLAIYHKETEPLVRHYEQQDKLLRINANQSIKKVFEEIEQKLKI